MDFCIRIAILILLITATLLPFQVFADSHHSLVNPTVSVAFRPDASFCQEFWLKTKSTFTLSNKRLQRRGVIKDKLKSSVRYFKDLGRLVVASILSIVVLSLIVIPVSMAAQATAFSLWSGIGLLLGSALIMYTIYTGLAHKLVGAHSSQPSLKLPDHITGSNYDYHKVRSTDLMPSSKTVHLERRGTLKNAVKASWRTFKDFSKIALAGAIALGTTYLIAMPILAGAAALAPGSQIATIVAYIFIVLIGAFTVSLPFYYLAEHGELSGGAQLYAFLLAETLLESHDRGRGRRSLYL